jgi:hypothetical protein
MPEPEDMDPDAPVTRAVLRHELQELRHELRQEFRQEFATKADLRQALEGFERRIFAELARHSLANQEHLAAQLGIVDEKYKDLPETRLEAAVFRPRRRARRT